MLFPDWLCWTRMILIKFRHFRNFFIGMCRGKLRFYILKSGQILYIEVISFILVYHIDITLPIRINLIWLGRYQKPHCFTKKKKKKNEMKKLIWVCKKYEFVVFRRQISKNRNILPEIIGFFKIVAEIQQLVWKRSQKINSDVILHYTSLPIYPFHFPNFRPIPKQ